MISKIKYVLKSLMHKDYFKGFTEDKHEYSSWSYNILFALEFNTKEEAEGISARIATATEIVEVKK